MDNYAIAEQFDLLARLMDIHGENSFKAKSYASAAFSIEQLEGALSGMPEAKIFAQKGIGESAGKKILELLQTGELKALQELLAVTPEGVLEMMNIKGIGPKKLHVLWKELGIDTIDKLKEACLQNRIAAVKGFGAKTQQKIIDSIQFQIQAAGKYLYAKVEAFALALLLKIQQAFPDELTELTGDFKRQLPVIESLQMVTTINSKALQDLLLNEQMQLSADRDGLLVLNADDTLVIQFHITDRENFYTQLLKTGSSAAFLKAWNAGAEEGTGAGSEAALFEKRGIAYIPAYLRESESILQKAMDNSLPEVVQVKDIRGLIHSHSNWSDGSDTIEVMAEDLIRRGFEYLVLSDHSKSAYYAKGLTEGRIREQHRYIDELNKKLAPFRIFKSIECDILSDGQLDYNDEVLASFDLVITSVHSNLDMPLEKAMTRLSGAISNPYTTILGHMTGRLLLRRPGYPVDHKAIIDACAANGVAIEINAHPVRLDMDWQWIGYALEKGVLLSINPDAHATDEFDNIKYGVLAAQKGGLTPAHNLSSFNLKEFEAYLAGRKH